MPTPFSIDVIKSPTHVMVICTCGWRCSVTRRQNARARTAKVNAAVAQHTKDHNTPVEG